MITIDVRGLQQLSQTLERMAAEQPKTICRALNDTAFKVMAAERAEMARVFDRPKPFVIRNVQVQKATVRGGFDRRTGGVLPPLTAVVGGTDHFNRGAFEQGRTGWERMIEPHIVGGPRLQKKSEVRLQRAGLLPAGWFTVPGYAIKRDQWGNIPSGEILAMLSWVGAMRQYAGDNLNRVKREQRRKNATERRGESYFVMRVGNRQGLPPGIYKRNDKKQQTDLFLLFVRQTTYVRRLDWYGIAHRTVEQEFPRALVAALGRS